MQLQQIGVISNPLSTRLVGKMDAIRRLLADAPAVRHHELGHIDEMTSVLRDFAAAGIDTVVLNGGDGTVQAAVTSLLNDQPYQALPTLCILPGGRTNMTAEAIGVTGLPDVVLANFLAQAQDDALPGAVSLPFVGMTLTPGSQAVYGTFFGAASVVRGIYTCREKFHPLNLPRMDRQCVLPPGDRDGKDQ